MEKNCPQDLISYVGTILMVADKIDCKELSYVLLITLFNSQISRVLEKKYKSNIKNIKNCFERRVTDLCIPTIPEPDTVLNCVKDILQKRGVVLRDDLNVAPSFSGYIPTINAGGVNLPTILVVC